MCSISCISAHRSSASDHSRASSGRTITGRRDAEGHGPGHGFVLEQFDGQGNAARVREASKFGAVPGHGQAGTANHRQPPQHADATGTRNTIAPATHARRSHCISDTAGSDARRGVRDDRRARSAIGTAAA